MHLANIHLSVFHTASVQSLFGFSSNLRHYHNWSAFTFGYYCVTRIFWFFPATSTDLCVSIPSFESHPLCEKSSVTFERVTKRAYGTSQSVVQGFLISHPEPKNNIPRSKPISWNQPICTTQFLQNLHLDEKHTSNILLCVYCVSFAQKAPSGASLKQENDPSHAICGTCSQSIYVALTKEASTHY